MKRTGPDVRVEPFGEGAVLVLLEQRIDERIAARAAAIADAWEAAGRGHAVPAYASALLQYDPLAIAPDDACELASRLAATVAEAAAARGHTLEVPTTYDGPDLDEVARLSGLTTRELVSLHVGREYAVFFVGFMPGFAYCGTLDPRIRAPRLEAPRPRVPAGSVAVADGQTAIYPFDSPGGWRLIGRTDRRVFDPALDPPALLRSGDRVRFIPR